MMSGEQIREMSRRAAVESRKAGKLPLVVEEEDLAPGVLERHLRSIPFIGDRNPKGFTPLRENRETVEHFVDSSGWGQPGELAETFTEFCASVAERGAGYAYAVVEAGQFQVHIRVYRPGKAKG